VEVAGAHYFSTGEFYARYPDVTAVRYPAALVGQYRQLAEDTIEEAMGTAWVPRAARETDVFGIRGGLRLERGPIRAVSTVTDSDGNSLTSPAPTSPATPSPATAGPATPSPSPTSTGTTGRRSGSSRPR
jgi:hypothetical protein